MMVDPLGVHVDDDDRHARYVELTGGPVRHVPTRRR